MSTPRKELTRMAREVERFLPDDHGYILMMAPFNVDNGKLHYTSNISRETAITLLKEFLFRTGEKEDWMKDIA